MNLREHARQRLIERAEDVLSPVAFDADGRVERLEDNFVPSIGPREQQDLKAQLARGDGGETMFDGNRRPSVHSALSSAMLAINAFGAWLGREGDLCVAGLRGFDQRLQVEAKQPIFRGGTSPNLDCLLRGSDLVVGIESKLTETLARHRRTAWSKAYSRENCRGLLSDGWLEALDSAMNGELHHEYLNADQLIKHALGLRKQNAGAATHLVYVYWEPVDAERHQEIRTHRDEVARFTELVGDSEPHFHPLSYTELWSEWDELTAGGWLRDHLQALRTRYVLSLET